jgi:hypothetical protein
MDIEPLSTSISSQVSYATRIREWIDACDSSHSDICVPKPIPEQPQDDVPVWLIDTHEQCIVPGSSAHRYLALSYTWPEARNSATPAPCSLLLDAESITELQIPRCFSGTAIAELLPGVIKHAMDVTVALGERYLWIDRLCIVQNDAGTLDQVTRMDKIYTGAYVTIIAAAPDVMYQSDELSEWPCFNPIYSYSVSPGLSRDKVVHVMDCRYEVLRASRWATRGWTYQEQILCKRAVIFTEKGIFWDCQCCMWDGADLKPGQDYETISVSADMGRRFTTRWWPDFSFYVDLICQYNGREFSYPQDALLGISGVLNALSRSFPGRFLSGIPSIFLDYVLPWQPFETAERRVDRLESSNIPANASSLPSWAWCGWQCFVDPKSLRSGLAYIDEDQIQNRARSWRTQNLVEWHMLNDQAQYELIPEPTVFGEYAKLSDSPNAPLPENWQVHDALNTDSLHFSHATDHKLFLKHPVPLSADIPRERELYTASYLGVRTTAAMLFPATVMRPLKPQEAVSWGEVKVSVFEDRTFALGPRNNKIPPILVLQQPNGMFGGLLPLMNHDRINPNQHVELIAISTGSVKAADLECSLEWGVFAEKEAFYSYGNQCKIIPFGSPLLTKQQKRALLFDSTMAFDERAAKDDDSGGLGPMLDAMDAEVNDHVQLEMSKSHIQSAIFNSEEHRQRFEQSIWFEARKKVLKQSRDGTTPSDAICHFYNVLWVQLKDGVAYRVACGWVPKHIWEAHAQGPMEVTLG